MKRINTCEWCGNTYEYEQNEPDPMVCSDCMGSGADNVGFLDEKDIELLKETK